VKADYAKKVNSGELVPMGKISYVDFIPNKDIPKMLELLQEVTQGISPQVATQKATIDIPNPPLAAPKTATPAQAPPATT